MDTITQLFNGKVTGSLLGVSERTLARERAAGRLAYVMVGGQVRYRQEDLAAYVEARSIGHKRPEPQGRSEVLPCFPDTQHGRDGEPSRTARSA